MCQLLSGCVWRMPSGKAGVWIDSSTGIRLADWLEIGPKPQTERSNIKKETDSETWWDHCLEGVSLSRQWLGRDDQPNKSKGLYGQMWLFRYIVNKEVGGMLVLVLKDQWGLEHTTHQPSCLGGTGGWMGPQWQRWQMAEMLNASQGTYPWERALCLLVETVSHHKDFEELGSSKITTPKRMCVWSSQTLGLFVNKAAKGVPSRNHIPTRKIR